ncbi:helix-turn-helix transcriptional regulator [Leucobacter viscericola]|nr:helix-turn-helix domain-containing protein [Leucobacter viscericola]
MNTRISELRQNLGWSQERLASESGVATRTIQRLEAGNDVSLETLSLIADALDVSVEELFTDVAAEGAVKAASDFENRKREQVAGRAREIHGWRLLYIGIGVIVTILISALVTLGSLPSTLFIIAGAYWAGGALILRFLVSSVLSARLDRRYPLTVPHR